MKFSLLVAQVTELLSDVTNVTWTRASIQQWLAEAERVIVGMPTGAGATSQAVPLAAGIRQQIPADGVRLIDVVRNMSGFPIRAIDRALKNETDPLWMARPNANVIHEWMFDARVPKEFLVSPPAAAGTQVELVYTKSPAVPNFSGDPSLSIDDIWAPAMVDYAAYRALARADENSPDAQRSQAFHVNFIAKVEGAAKGNAMASLAQAGGGK